MKEHDERSGILNAMSSRCFDEMDEVEKRTRSRSEDLEIDRTLSFSVLGNSTRSKISRFYQTLFSFKFVQNCENVQIDRGLDMLEVRPFSEPSNLIIT